MADSSQDFGTVLASDASFKGDLTFDSAAKLLGKFEGSITSKGKVLIAGGAQCKAAVKAGEISIEGLVEGNVEATDRVELKSKGVINGDIVAARMVVAEGASIDGHCRIGVNGQSGSKAASSTAEVKPSAQQAAAASRK